MLHAVAAQLVKTGHPAAVAFMALLEAAGWIFGIDFALINLEQLAEAGRHFQRMELLHRTAQGEKAELIELSERHLTLGARALLDAMADFIAMGVLIGGSHTISRFGWAPDGAVIRLVRRLFGQQGLKCWPSRRAGREDTVEADDIHALGGNRCNQPTQKNP